MVHGKLTAWADGASCTVTPGAPRADGAVEYRVAVASPSPKPVLVALRIEQQRGLYGGAAIPEPVKQECGVGRIALGDRGVTEGLRCYSGGVWYRKTIRLATDPVQGKLVLDLGNVVSTAELRMNGKSAGIKVCAALAMGCDRSGPARREPDRGTGLQHTHQSLPNHSQPLQGLCRIGPARAGNAGSSGIQPNAVEVFGPAS